MIHAPPEILAEWWAFVSDWRHPIVNLGTKWEGLPIRDPLIFGANAYDVCFTFSWRFHRWYATQAEADAMLLAPRPLIPPTNKLPFTFA